jgi:hypothetical protein
MAEVLNGMREQWWSVMAKSPLFCCLDYLLTIQVGDSIYLFLATKWYARLLAIHQVQQK